VFLFQLPNEVDADVYPVSLEIDEVKPSAIIGRV
jgi:hypothetical protein